MNLDIFEFMVSIVIVALVIACAGAGVLRLISAAARKMSKKREDDPALMPTVVLTGILTVLVLGALFVATSHAEQLASNEHQLELDSRFTGGRIESFEAIIEDDGTPATIVYVRGDDGKLYPYKGTGRIVATGRVQVEYIFTNTVIGVRDEPDGCVIGPFRLDR